MNQLSFPGINLNININKIAFTIGNIPIYSYAICIVIAILIAFFLLNKSKENYNIDFDFSFYTIIYCLIFGIIGARIYYILFNLEYYLLNPLQMLNFRSGGLAIYGGIISGLIVVIIRCKKNKIKIYDFLDYIVPFFAIAQSIGRWGNFFNIEAYGTTTNNLFRMGIYTIDGYKEVHPVFLYESILTLFLFILLRLKQKNRKFKGEIVLIYLIIYSFVRFFLEELRIDSLMFYSVRISSLISTIIFIISLILYLNGVIKCRKMSKNIKKEKSKNTPKALI